MAVIALTFYKINEETEAEGGSCCAAIGTCILVCVYVGGGVGRGRGRGGGRVVIDRRSSSNFGWDILPTSKQVRETLHVRIPLLLWEWRRHVPQPLQPATRQPFLHDFL